jgi:selenocysteine-specific elongation factor
VLDELDHEVSRRGAFHAHFGTAEHMVRLRVLGHDAIAPGADGRVRLHLPVALPLVPGDRYILRESGRGETVGGGEVLDVAPVLSARHARPSRSVERVIAERGWVRADELVRLTGESRPVSFGQWVVSPEAAAATEKALRDAIGVAGQLGMDVSALDERSRAVLGSLPDVSIDAGRARLRGADALVEHPFLAALSLHPFSPPDPDGVDRAVLRELVRRGVVVEQDGVYFAPEAIEQAADATAMLLGAHPEGVTVAQVRDALGTTRRYVLPLLARLDTTGVTRRRGDVRIAGPRLPAVGR